METAAYRVDRTAAFCVFAFVFALGLMQIWETDAWWHLAAGRQIAAEQQLPDTDSFSHSMQGREWVNEAWLGDAYLYAIYSRHGAPGIVVCAALLGACAFFLTLGVSRLRNVPAAAAALPVALAAVAARTRIAPRPEIFALAIAALDLYLIHKYLENGEDDDRARKFLWLLPVMQILWTNFHMSAIMGPAFAGLAVAASMAAFLLNMRRGADAQPFGPAADSRAVRRLSLMFVLCMGAMLLNPYTIHAWTAPFDFASNAFFLNHIAEWAPLPREVLLHPLAGDPQELAFKALAVLGALGLAARFRRQNLFDTALLALTLYMALRSRRFMALFAIAATPGIASNLYHAARSLPWFSDGRMSRLAQPAAGAVILLLALLAWSQIARDTRAAFGTQPDARRFPAAATDFIARNNLQGNMYNDYGLGGWLIWRLGPERKVFIDGRTHFYGQDFFRLNHELEAAPSIDKWLRIQRDYDISYAVLNPRSPHQRNLFYMILSSAPDWRVVFWDQRAIILARDLPANSAAVRAHAYELANPYSLKKLAEQWDALPGPTRAQLVSELNRNIKLVPDNVLALWARAYIAMREGDPDTAARLARQGLAADARHADLYALLGQLALNRNEPHAARRLFAKAARFNPKYRALVRELD